MKKILILLSLIIWIFSSYTFAGWGCYQDPIVPVNYMAKITTAARVRDRPCMKWTKVLAVAYLWEIVQVIADNDGWIKIKRSNGTEGRVGTWLTTKINQAPPKPAVNTDNLYSSNSTNNKYHPTKKDKIFLDKVYKKIDIISKKSPKKLETILTTISKAKKNYFNKARLYYILEQIEEYLIKKIDMIELENLFKM